jgi:hypothetical protein
VYRLIEPPQDESQIIWLPIEDLVPDVKRLKKYSAKDSSLVIDSIKLNGYHPDAPPLLVSESIIDAHKHIVFDGNDCLEGATQNPKITKLPCIVLKNIKINEARQIAMRRNSSVRNIKKSPTLAQVIIESLDKAHKYQPNRKNIILAAEEFAFLKKQTGKSQKTLNRALHPTRKIIKWLCNSNPQALSGGVRACLETVVGENVCPELTDFYFSNICPSVFERIFLKRSQTQNIKAQEKTPNQDLTVEQNTIDVLGSTPKNVTDLPLAGNKKPNNQEEVNSDKPEKKSRYYNQLELFDKTKPGGIYGE